MAPASPARRSGGWLRIDVELHCAATRERARGLSTADPGGGHTGCVRDAGRLAISLVSGLIVGVTFLGVAKAFTDVVQTQGNDIGNLMTAIRGLGRALLTPLFAVLAAFCIGFFGAVSARST